jgi:serine/threonine-protein kinase
MAGRDLLQTTVGEYRLVDFLGAGGMGEVYRAVHSKLGRVVAVKVMTNAAKSPSLIERFFNEARIQSSLNHPGIVTLYDFLQLDGQPCIVMEYVDGQSLSDRIKHRGAIAVPEALAFFRTVADAVAYVHSNGIVHRDIKSNNIKISNTGQVKLLDFGIARTQSGPRMTATGDVIGTLEYLSPEQIRGGTADARSDIWALGILLYEMVTGHVPFEAPTLGDLCDKISKAAYVQPSLLNPSVPRQVDALIARCLKRNPAERYQSAHQLVADAAKIETGESPEQGRKFKLWWIAAPAGFVVVLVVLFFAIQSLAPADSQQSQRETPVRGSTAGNAQKPAIAQAAAGDERVVQIETSEGPARVFLGGLDVGATPYSMKARPGDKISLVLKRDGFEDKPVDLTVGENPRPYTFTLSKLESQKP